MSLCPLAEFIDGGEPVSGSKRACRVPMSVSDSALRTPTSETATRSQIQPAATGRLIGWLESAYRQDWLQ